MGGDLNTFGGQFNKISTNKYCFVAIKINMEAITTTGVFVLEINSKRITRMEENTEKRVERRNEQRKKRGDSRGIRKERVEKRRLRTERKLERRAVKEERGERRE